MPHVNRGGVLIGAIVGAIIGVLLLLILGVAIAAVVILYLVRRRNTGGNYSTGRRASEKKVSVECKQCMHGITEQQLTETENSDSKMHIMDKEQNMKYESSTGHDAQISLASNVAYSKSRKPLDTNMEHNVAYGSFTDVQISLTSNVAYFKSVKQFEENNNYENEYDYIITSRP
jgi:hypothetical protein